MLNVTLSITEYASTFLLVYKKNVFCSVVLFYLDPLLHSAEQLTFFFQIHRKHVHVRKSIFAVLSCFLPVKSTVLYLVVSECKCHILFQRCSQLFKSVFKYLLKIILKIEKMFCESGSLDHKGAPKSDCKLLFQH